MSVEKQINYIEIPTNDPPKACDFFARLFGWSLQDWGPAYLSFNDGRLDGGFRRSDTPVPAAGVLVVFYSKDLERDMQRVKELGAVVSQDSFTFPGGRRFHFLDPTGTESAIWSDN